MENSFIDISMAIESERISKDCPFGRSWQGVGKKANCHKILCFQVATKQVIEQIFPSKFS